MTSHLAGWDTQGVQGPLAVVLSPVGWMAQCLSPEDCRPVQSHPGVLRGSYSSIDCTGIAGALTPVSSLASHGGLGVHFLCAPTPPAHLLQLLRKDVLGKYGVHGHSQGGQRQTETQIKRAKTDCTLNSKLLGQRDLTKGADVGKCVKGTLR